MRRAIYSGTFDPVTYGHMDIIERSAILFDELVIGVLVNKNKTPWFTLEERVEMIKAQVKHLPNVKVVSFSGLLVDFAKEVDAKFVVRGLRNAEDFEYELRMAFYNRNLDADIETIFLTTSLEYTFLSSSAVREVYSFGGDISNYVPPLVEDMIKNKIDN